MPRVFLQPAASGLAHEHLARSIEQAVSAEMVDQLSPSSENLIRSELGDGGFRLWGAREGDKNRMWWESMRPRDVVLFYTGDRKFKYFAEVVSKADCQEFGKLVWETDSKGRAFSLLFSLSEPRDPKITLDDLIQALNYGEGYTVQNFYGLDEQQSETVLGLLSVFSARVYDDVIDDLTAKREEFEGLPETECEAVQKSRIGQGKFRDGLLDLWGRCAITGITNPRLLRASHIKPWRDCDNQERLDPMNGFLLLPHFDHLFDCGLISFRDNGEIIISSQLENEERDFFHVHAGMCLQSFAKGNRPFLHYHREHVFVP